MAIIARADLEAIREKWHMPYRMTGGASLGTESV